MTSIPPALLDRLLRSGQDHFIPLLEALTGDERHRFTAQLEAIHWDELADLFAGRTAPAVDALGELEPMPVSEADEQFRAIGEAALKAGEVAALVVAGGQGTRLGFDKPKGLFPVGPISGSSLFQIHAEKVLALSRRSGVAIPLLVMTSEATHADTVEFFALKANFGLSSGQVHFFKQGTMPALDLETGRALLEGPGELVLSPNGHGGSLTALADSGLLARLKAAGIRHLFYFQIDNALVKVGDPVFLGQHIAAGSEASSKVVFKERPEEKVGLLVRRVGRCGIVEYSDLPKEAMFARTADGTLAYRAGNPAIHLFAVDFLERVTSGPNRLAYHLARKKVPYYDPVRGVRVQPEAENALKFELFIFDALPLAERTLAVATPREDEFAPLKNASGVDSLATVHELILNRNRRWLEAAGATVDVNARIEISPLVALEARDLMGRFDGRHFAGDTLLS